MTNPPVVPDTAACEKVPHDNPLGGYLHDAEDGGPYDVDGVTYCGRCHVAWMSRSKVLGALRHEPPPPRIYLPQAKPATTDPAAYPSEKARQLVTNAMHTLIIANESEWAPKRDALLSYMGETERERDRAIADAAHMSRTIDACDERRALKQAVVDAATSLLASYSGSLVGGKRLADALTELSAAENPQ